MIISLQMNYTVHIIRASVKYALEIGFGDCLRKFLYKNSGLGSEVD